jgi:hypothetical protein
MKMTYANQEMMPHIDFEKVIVDTFVDNVCIETVIFSPDIIYDNVALYYHESTNSSDFVYLE